MLITIIRRYLAVLGVTTVAVLCPLGSGPANAGTEPAPAASTVPTVSAASTMSSVSTGSTASTGADSSNAPNATDKEATMLDGFTLGYLPDGLGPSVSDFDYEWEDVTFHTRVWERGPDAEGNFSVDLQVAVLRGDRLTDPAALRDFLAEYLEQDPQTWELEPYERGEYRGFIAPDRVFFLVQPGVAVMASAYGPVVDRAELLAIADGIEPATDNPAAES